MHYICGHGASLLPRRMRYDPVKDRLGALFSRHPWLQLCFFGCMNVLLLRAWHVRRALRRILADKPGTMRVLDAGTGFGQYAWFVARTFPRSEVTAVDIKEEYLAQAQALFERRAPNIVVQYADLTALPLPGPFDCILAVDVMEHIEEDRDVLKHFERVLAPGGHVVISTPSDKGGSDAHTTDEDGFIDEHVRDGYSMEELAEKLASAGLPVTGSRYTYGVYGSLAWRLVMKVPLSALNLSWAFVLLLPAYYLITLPVALVLHSVDTRRINRSGTGLLVIAQKP